MALGNELGLTHELFTQLEQMAREKLEETKQVNKNKTNLNKKKTFFFPSWKMLVVIILDHHNYVSLLHIQVKQQVHILNLFN